MIDGEPPEFSLTPQEIINELGGSPELVFAGPYVLMAWHRLFLSDDPAARPAGLVPTQARALALFSERKEAKRFLEIMIADVASLRYSVSESPLAKRPRPGGRPPRPFDKRKLRKLFRRLLRSAERGKRLYHRGETEPENILLPGIQQRRRAKTTWVPIWHAGWPNAWAYSVLKVLLDIEASNPAEALRNHLR